MEEMEEMEEVVSWNVRGLTESQIERR